MMKTIDDATFGKQYREMNQSDNLEHVKMIGNF